MVQVLLWQFLHMMSVTMNSHKEFDLEINAVLEGGDIEKEAFTGDGAHINSGFLDGLNKEDGIAKAIEWLEENGVGEKKVTYRLRDWLFTRQRYWGEPIPVIHWEDGTMTTIPEEELPLALPKTDKYSSFRYR